MGQSLRRGGPSLNVSLRLDYLRNQHCGNRQAGPGASLQEGEREKRRKKEGPLPNAFPVPTGKTVTR